MEVTKSIESFQDTLNRCAGEDLVELTREAVAGSRVYTENFVSQRLYKVREAEIQVVKGTTFQTARENLDGGKVAVLNFAASQDGVLLYPDQVKLQISMASGRVVGAECSQYLMNHGMRESLIPGVRLDVTCEGAGCC